MSKVLYLIDDLDFVGGAHVASANLISALRTRGYTIDVLTNKEPSDAARHRFGGASFWVWQQPAKGIPSLVRKIWYRIFGSSAYFPDWSMDPSGIIRRIMRAYDCVCVMSEASPLRKLVADLPDRIRKVQLIHNDYVLWSQASDYARHAARCDSRIYSRMSQIGVVGNYNARAFARCFPALASKTESFYNVISSSVVNKRKPMKDRGAIQIVTVARADEVQKASARSVGVAKRLVSDGYDIEWTFYGNGYEDLEQDVRRANMSSRIHFAGMVSEVSERLANYDLMTLFSHYEGVPMVVYEAFSAGVPVAATAVSGLNDIILDGINGWLYADDEEEILKGLKGLLDKREKIGTAMRNLTGYTYDNERVIAKHVKLLGLDKDKTRLDDR